MGKINSRRKGAEGERELAEFLRERGVDARRGQQFSGGTESPDVVHDIPGLHIECKRVESLELYKALEQAGRDAGFDKAPVVFHRRNKKPWVVVMLATDFLAMAVSSLKAHHGTKEG